jgi:hypothetical protein
MGFASGSISFRRFAVIGKAPKTPDQNVLDKLAEHGLQTGDDAAGVPEEVEYGWSGGRHVFDQQFTFEHNVFADAVHFALRIDTNKVPGELKKAYQIMEEESVAAGNPSGFISKAQKKDVKESIRAKLDEDLRSGKYRRSKLLPVMWDLARGVVYCAASGASFEKLAELFHRTFELDLQPLTAGSLALRICEARGKRRDYEDFRPTRFVTGPEGESVYPDYPWVAKGPEPKDFLGNEFLLWLWHEADAKTARVHAEGAGEVTIFFDKSLDLDCAYGQTGRDGLRGDGPSRSPEARDALRTGKLPRKAGLVLDLNRQQFMLNLNPEAFAVGTAKLPDVEDADTARTLFEERIQLLRDLCAAVDGLFDTFLKTRASSAWEGYVNHVRRWIVQPVKHAAA